MADESEAVGIKLTHLQELLKLGVLRTSSTTAKAQSNGIHGHRQRVDRFEAPGAG
jgi:hypothetical protein